MSAETMVVHLSYQNCKRNRPSMRHQYQDTVEDIAVRQVEAGVFGEHGTGRHNFLRRCDVEGVLSPAYDSHPTGRTRVGADSQIHKDLLPAAGSVAGNIDDSQRVWRIHGEAGFIIS